MSTTSSSPAAFGAVICLFVSLSFASPARAQRVNLLSNGGFEAGSLPWSRQVFDPSASLSWDSVAAREGSHSINITADRPNDAACIQTVTLKPDTNYLLSGWIKTENVQHTAESVTPVRTCVYSARGCAHRRRPGPTDWTEVRMTFNSGPTGTVTVGARLGFWSGTTTGSAGSTTCA